MDEHQRLLGIVTVDDVVDVIREEAAEDMMRMAVCGDGTTGRSVWYLVRSRFGWLLATLVGGILASVLISFFEETLTDGILAGFIPVVMGMGGNVGIQSATILCVVLQRARCRLAVRCRSSLEKLVWALFSRAIRLTAWHLCSCSVLGHGEWSGGRPICCCECVFGDCCGEFIWHGHLLFSRVRVSILLLRRVPS